MSTEPASFDEHFNALAEMRCQVAGLLAAIDTGELPRPDKIRDGRGKQPGPEWRPAHNIRVFTIDTRDDADIVYMAQEQYGYCLPGDWESFTVGDARRLGMALLAAADWAEQHRAQVPRLDARRARKEAT